MADHFGSRDECKRFLSQLSSNPLKTNQAPIQPKASISKPHSSQPLFLHRAGLLFSSANQVNVQIAVHSADSLCAQLLLDPLSTDRKTCKLTLEQLQRVTQELVFNGLHNAQQLCKQEGLPLLSVKFQHLEWALAYGSRQEILTALNILESGREPVAAFDKLLFKVLSLLDVGGGDYMQIQAARFAPDALPLCLFQLVPPHSHWHSFCVPELVVVLLKGACIRCTQAFVSYQTSENKNIRS
jgi:hypothetical protein